MHYGCWQFIIQTKPEQLDEEATYKEKLDLQLRKDRCYTLIYNHISSGLKNLITEITDGVAAWKILKDHFEPVTRARIIQLLDHSLEQDTNQGKMLESSYIVKVQESFIQKDGAVRSKRPLELLHMDLCGPMPTESQGGNKYFLSIIDDYSRKVTVFPIRNNSDIFHTFIRFQKRAERFLSKKGFSDLSEQQEALMVEVTIPNCYKQAIRSRDASKWHDAMDKEINVMMKRKVWDLVGHPDNIKILENRWVYTIKYDENNKIVRYKARLVARALDSSFSVPIFKYQTNLPFVSSEHMA
ncbi:retrovirus-related Pol polyprotein from transposon RE1 [Trichonephila clavipes]|nr:retrovirus-related Pol polyprotein from transposon RE1 [Trichonephila clavipes]